MEGTRQPERTCVGCRTPASKAALVRFVRDSEGQIRLDPTAKAPGRGAYLHPDPECAQVALRHGAVGRALRVKLERSEAARLMEELTGSMKEVQALP